MEKFLHEKVRANVKMKEVWKIKIDIFERNFINLYDEIKVYNNKSSHRKNKTNFRQI